VCLYRVSDSSVSMKRPGTGNNSSSNNRSYKKMKKYFRRCTATKDKHFILNRKEIDAAGAN